MNIKPKLLNIIQNDLPGSDHLYFSFNNSNQNLKFLCLDHIFKYLNFLLHLSIVFCNE